MITQAPPKEMRQKKPPASEGAADAPDEDERRAMVEKAGLDYIEFMRFMRALSSVRAKQR
jgi:hypothetical protein